MEEKKVTHIADVVYELEKMKAKVKYSMGYLLTEENIEKLINKLTETEEYKESIKEAQKVPEYKGFCIDLDEYNKESKENDEKSILNAMCEKSSNGWVGIEDWIDEVVKRKVKKYLHNHPDWYHDRYEKIPYWLRPDYNKPEPTCWKEDTDMFKVNFKNQNEMFKVHPESEPIYAQYNTYTAPANSNTTTILS